MLNIVDNEKLSKEFSEYAKYGNHKLCIKTRKMFTQKISVIIWCKTCEAHTATSFFERDIRNYRISNEISRLIKRSFETYKRCHPNTCELVKIQKIMES